MDEISNLGVFGYRVYDTELFGVSSFYRVGDLKTVIEDRNAKMSEYMGWFQGITKVPPLVKIYSSLIVDSMVICTR